MRLAHQQIAQVQHIAAVRGAEYQALGGELESHLTQELNHALTLARQIDFLGGRPTVQVPDVPDIVDTRDALEADLALEREQLKRYRERVSQAEELGLRDVAEAINPVLEQTQDHVHELCKALDVPFDENAAGAT